MGHEFCYMIVIDIDSAIDRAAKRLAKQGIALNVVRPIKLSNIWACTETQPTLRDLIRKWRKSANRKLHRHLS